MAAVLHGGLIPEPVYTTLKRMGYIYVNDNTKSKFQAPLLNKVYGGSG